MSTNGSPLTKALDKEIAQRKRRMKTIAPRYEALRAEYEQLRDEVAQFEAIRDQLPGVSAARDVTPPPAFPADERIRQYQQDIRDCLTEHGALSPADLALYLKWPRTRLVEPLRALVDAGEVVAQGATKSRTYSLRGAA